jgi:hypothetical protein
MRNSQTAQLAFEFYDNTPSGLFQATRTLRRHRRYRTVLKKLSYVRRFFPEFGQQCIRVGLTRAATGMAVPGGHEIWINPNQVNYHTIAHELVHLLQGRHGIPTGERACDLYSLARHWTLNDTAPYYVRVPRRLVDEHGNIQPPNSRLIHAVAQRALDLKRRGVRNYIACFEKVLTSDDASAWLRMNPLRDSNEADRACGEERVAEF